MLKLSPSVLSADFGHLAEDIQIIDSSGCYGWVLCAEYFIWSTGYQECSSGI